MDIKLIRAFIASPGGLEAERRTAYAAAEEINRSVARPLRGRLELIGWEETLSGVGRPQATINADMDTCDLFIGIMWSTWGSRPSVDGPYTSGFEEEFELSRLRNAETYSPTMAMFLKSVDPMQLNDPGDDLKKVLSFQEKLRAEKSFLYSTFDSVDEFATKIREFLANHVIQILTRADVSRDERPVEAVRKNEAVGQKTLEAGDRDAPHADFVVQTIAALRSLEGPDSVQVARLRLIALSAGGTENDKQILGTHDANLIYEKRGRFALSLMEKQGLLETGLSGINDENVPVWTWIADLSEKRPDLLMELTLFGEVRERIGAINAMRMLKSPIRKLFIQNVDFGTNGWLGTETPAAVKVAALHYLRDLGGRIELAAVQHEAELAATETVTAALEAVVAILLRQSDEEAITYLLGMSFEKLDTGLQFRALAQVRQLSLQQLRRGLDHRSSEIRAAVLLELGERSAVDLETLGRARADESAKVRYAALCALDHLGQTTSLDEAQKVLVQPPRGVGYLTLLSVADTSGVSLFNRYQLDRMRSMPQATLEVFLGAPAHRDAAYQTLASRRLGDFGARLRADLRDGFEHYFAQHWPDGIKPADDFAPIFGFFKTDPAFSKKRELIRDALDVVAAQRDAADLGLVRDTLDRKKALPSAQVIAFLKVMGASQDVVRLADTSPFSFRRPDDGVHYRDFDEAARVMLKMTQGTLAELLISHLPEKMRARLIDLVPSAEFGKLTNGFIVELLLSSDSGVRRSTAKKVPASVVRKRVSQVLAAYRSEPEGRFYNVTYWLDIGLAYDRPIARRVAAAARAIPP